MTTALLNLYIGITSSICGATDDYIWEEQSDDPK